MQLRESIERTKQFSKEKLCKLMADANVKASGLAIVFRAAERGYPESS
jgi:hypothetical protein